MSTAYKAAFCRDEDMLTRGSGVLLHLTSLPSAFGIGDLGPAAYEFADFLADSEQKYWQILPLNPINSVSGHSPYHSFSAFAFNPLLISPDLMATEGWLDRTDMEPLLNFRRERIGFDRVLMFRKNIFDLAFRRFEKIQERSGFKNFCEKNVSWLEDYALFMALKSRFGGKPWTEWPRDVRNRHPGSLKILKAELQKEMEKAEWLQFLFQKQWIALKEYCNRKGIFIFGDIPIYVVHDSVDVWSHPELFKLDANNKPFVVAGVPPDYFSRTGQLWGNPIYRWDVLKETGYEWWIERLKHNFRLFDLVRIDHFRGFVGYWEVPAGERTAINGKWVEAPAMDFFNAISQKFPSLPIVAEDLGTITPDVKEVMGRFGIPGMKILLFAFGEDNPNHPYLPHTYHKNCLVYTGTHDNNTVKGWFETEASPEDRKRLFDYLGLRLTAEEVSWELIKLGSMSSADVLIVPLQDILSLGEEARMNRPGRQKGNWRWRYLPGQLTPTLSKKLAGLTKISGRV
jgi:4-alpha-glucanotransferase